jgi:hypothetical protein
MSDFTDGAAVLFADENFSSAGTYTAPGGAAVAVRVVVFPTDPRIGSQQTGARSQGWRASIARTDLATVPVEGATLVVADGDFPAPTSSWVTRRRTRAAPCGT